MSGSHLNCRDDRRRQDVRKKDLNGLDYIEVDPDTRTLLVYFINQAPSPEHLPKVWLEGGSRIPARDIRILAVDVCPPSDPELDRCMQIKLDRCGDLSTYRLCMASDEWNSIDPFYACLDFSFAAALPGSALPGSLDCKSEPDCPPAVLPTPEINYLAKDYASFRQVILDRLALIMPGWKERHVPDLGITLVELLAYVGDHLSYYQDAVGTEAYLDTARKRISVRRHARLVDYRLHEGCSARAWVCVQVEPAELIFDPTDIFFATSLGERLPSSGTVLAETDLLEIPGEAYLAFEPLVKSETTLYHAHNELRFYTWGERECCLPKGSTRAFLRYFWQETPPPQEPPPASKVGPKGKPGAAGGAALVAQHSQAASGVSPDSYAPAQLNGEGKLLKVGDLLVLAEVKGPRSGDPADADPTHRHVVRLTEVNYTRDELYDPPITLVEIAWAPEDALPFPLCISAIGAPPDCAYIDHISVAWGNVLLVDHGRRMSEPEPFTPGPGTELETDCLGEKQPDQPRYRPARFNPRVMPTLRVGRKPLTHCVPLASGELEGTVPVHLPAARLLEQDPRQAVPQIWLTEGEGPAAPTWSPQLDLLASGPTERHFVVETDNEGYANLRFGDGESGLLPAPMTPLHAVYRIGSGRWGNVGAESITHLVYRLVQVAGIIRVFNPLPAAGGADPEPLEEARLFAPTAFRLELLRAITPADYAALANRNPKVQRAAASLRWTGSWYEVQVAIDPYGHAELDEALRLEIERSLEPYRRIGHDLRVLQAVVVPLEIHLQVCLKPHALRGHVRAALLDIFSTRRLPDGTYGFFHPDQLSFGQGIYTSQLTALAQAVPGVESVKVTRLWRLWEPFSEEEGRIILEDGLLALGLLEVPRLDNDPNQPDNGLLTLDLKGGR